MERTRTVFLKDNVLVGVPIPKDPSAPVVLRPSKLKTNYTEEVRRRFGCDNPLCQYYRRTNVQIVTKSITSVPFLVLWALWIAGELRQEDSWEMLVYNLILSGSILTYPWLMLCCWFNLTLMLQVWSIFSIFWSGLCFMAVIQLYQVDPLIASLLLLLAMMCLIDGLLSSGLRLPSLPDKPEESEFPRESLALPTYRPPGDGPFFFYVPLRKGKPEPIIEPLPEYASFESDSGLMDFKQQKSPYLNPKEGTSKDA